MHIDGWIKTLNKINTERTLCPCGRASLSLPYRSGFADAWYVNAKASPLTGAGTITPSGNQSYPTGVDSGEYTVTPAAGKSVSRVTLDGANLSPGANGKYVVPYLAGKSWR